MKIDSLQNHSPGMSKLTCYVRWIDCDPVQVIHGLQVVEHALVVFCDGPETLGDGVYVPEEECYTDIQMKDITQVSIFEKTGMLTLQENEEVELFTLIRT